MINYLEEEKLKFSWDYAAQVYSPRQGSEQIKVWIPPNYN